jgi:GntR family transcriptional regulator
MVLIQRSNPIPLYIQLKDLIVEKIENAEWKPGETIPTEMELQKQYNLSRTTVRQGLAELVTSGYLERIQGKGTFVSAPKLEPLRPDLTSFTQDMSQKGHKVTSLILNQKNLKVTEKLSRIFNLKDASENVFIIERVRLVDGQPIGYHETYLNISIQPQVNLNKYNFSKDSLYSALQQNGVIFGEADETVEGNQINELQARHLNVPVGSTALKLTRTTKLYDGRPFEHSIMVYRADKFKYTIKLK